MVGLHLQNVQAVCDYHNIYESVLPSVALPYERVCKQWFNTARTILWAMFV